MPAILDSPVAKGPEFRYDDSPQKSPQWLAIKRGRIGSSNTWKWLAVSKAKATLGQPLKVRIDYEKELQFERQFNTNFEHFTNAAMDQGNEFEAWAARQYEQTFKVELERVGCWYNEWYCASPDRRIAGAFNAGVEIKVVYDTTFTEIMSSVKLLRENDEEALKKTTSAYKHWQQMQGQMWATGWDYVDYLMVNLNSRKFAIIRVVRDEEFIKKLANAVQEELSVPKFETGAVHDIKGEIPVGLVMPDEQGDSPW